MTRAENSSRVEVTFLVSVMLFLSWQGWVAGRNGLSDVYAAPAIHYLDGMGVAGLGLSDVEWQAVFENISRADELMPGNPSFLDRLGWLEETRLSRPVDVLDIDRVDEHARAAEDYYRSALAARPTWSDYWGSLARQMHRRGSYETDEYSVALANAARFGPWMDDTQQLVAELGRDTLQFLSASAQREFLLNLERGLSRQPDTMRSIIRDWDIVCETAIVSDDSLPKLSSYCQRDGND